MKPLPTAPPPPPRAAARLPEEKADPENPYSAADFLPISRHEIVQTAAQSGNLMANAWQTGRSSIIPPADDPRTKLIDRALVTHGFLTPEELIEIHRVGDEYARVKPNLENIALKVGLAGEAAVKAYREAKERLKAQKKAESAARKKQREADVKRRRETDVIFLGAGGRGGCTCGGATRPG